MNLPSRMLWNSRSKHPRLSSCTELKRNKERKTMNVKKRIICFQCYYQRFHWKRMLSAKCKVNQNIQSGCSNTWDGQIEEHQRHTRTNRLIDKQTNRQIDKQTERQTNRQTEIEASRPYRGSPQHCNPAAAL